MTTQTDNRYYLPESWSSARENKLRVRHVCAECGEELNFWRDRPRTPIFLACHRHNINGHEGIARQFTPPSDKETLIRREDMSDENVGQHQSLALRGIPLTGIINKEQAVEILRTVWKGAPDNKIMEAAILCRDFGLHPLMKHIYLIKYKTKDGDSWVTVMGIGATRLLMSRQGTFSYVDDTPRVMNEDEQKRIFGKVDPDNVLAITKLKTKDGLQAQGYGRWARATTVYGADKGNSAENMAFIRSERNAFSRLFPDAKFPTNVEVIDEQYFEALPQTVDPETGEITDSQADADPKATAPAAATAKPTLVGGDFTTFWTTAKERGYSPTEVELILGCTVPTWLKKPENKGKGLDYILAGLPEKKEA